MFGKLRGIVVGIGYIALTALGVVESNAVSARHNVVLDSFLVTILDIPLSILSLFDWFFFLLLDLLVGVVSRNLGAHAGGVAIFVLYILKYAW